MRQDFRHEAQRMAKYRDVPLFAGVPDSIWPTDNKFGIPLLSIDRQADCCELPVTVWGESKRSEAQGTVLFYTDDSRFNGLMKNPDSLLQSQAKSFAEPNFSIYKDFPLALAVHRIYQKRWLARYWQSQGLRCFVDLNVHYNYYELNLLGVPRGWKAYATRGYTERIEFLAEEHSMATDHAGTKDILFLVYGGGKLIKQWCEDNGAIWISERMDRVRGIYSEVIYG